VLQGGIEPSGRELISNREKYFKDDEELKGMKKPM
jgi:hypothetical protein